jgi:hypothetical protein
VTVYGKKRWRRRFEASLRRHTRYWVLIGVGLVLMLGAGTAMAAIVLSGKGTLVAPAYSEQQLRVTDERLSTPLVPGGAADLLFVVRNPNSFSVTVDRVSLASPLRKAKPAGCTAKVSGPATRADGYPIPAAERVTVPAGGQAEVTLAGAFKLATSAAGGCGFTVDILVSATQGPVAPGTPTAAQSSDPTPKPPVTEPATTHPATTEPAPPSTPTGNPPPADGGGSSGDPDALTPPLLP